MKKINKKGFTLIELLAVIVILVLLLLVSPKILKVMKDSRKNIAKTSAQGFLKTLETKIVSEQMKPDFEIPEKINCKSNGKKFTSCEPSDFLDKNKRWLNSISKPLPKEIKLEKEANTEGSYTGEITIGGFVVEKDKNGNIRIKGEAPTQPSDQDTPSISAQEVVGKKWKDIFTDENWARAIYITWNYKVNNNYNEGEYDGDALITQTQYNEFITWTSLDLDGEFSYKLIKTYNNIGIFKNLTHLDFKWNQISELKGLESLTNLTHLNLSYNQIQNIKGLEKLPNLIFLDLSNNQISEIQGLEKLPNLTHLNLYHNQISEIQGLEKLINLKKIDLSNNQIKRIGGLDKLTNLDILSLYDNQISEIQGLDELTNLTSLGLSGTQISEIKGLDKLINLTSLELSRNKIEVIKGLDVLIQLKGLSLNNNEISEIQGLDNLLNLTYLDLATNQIISLQEPLPNLPKLNNIYLEKQTPPLSEELKTKLKTKYGDKVVV